MEGAGTTKLSTQSSSTLFVVIIVTVVKVMKKTTSIKWENINVNAKESNRTRNNGTFIYKLLIKVDFHFMESNLPFHRFNFLILPADIGITSLIQYLNTNNRATGVFFLFKKCSCLGGHTKMRNT